MYNTKSGAELGVKRLVSETGIKRSAAREIAARACGYRDWHHLVSLIGKESAPNMPDSPHVLQAYLVEQGLENLVVAEILQLLWPERAQQQDAISAAKIKAVHAQNAYEDGKQLIGAQYVEEALMLDPLCTHALLQKASRLTDLENRLLLERQALEGAARSVVSDQSHLIERFRSYDKTARRQWGDRVEQDEDENIHVFAEATSSGAFTDRWPELSMRDYVSALFSLGETLVRLGRPAEAVVHLRELCSQSPSNRYNSKVWLCAAHLQLGDFAGAERIARIETNEDIRWGAKVIALCETVDGRRTAKYFAEEHPYFTRLLAENAKVPMPGPEMEESEEYGYKLSELDHAMTPEWARAIACAARSRPEIAKVVNAAAACANA